MTAAWLLLARSRRWLDLPDERRLHAQATPRGGGIGILVLALATMCWLAAAGGHEAAFWRLSALGLLVCGAAGLLDDLGRLGSFGKLLMQLLAAILLALALLSLKASPDPWWLGAGLVVSTLLLVNFTNFMDGSDGLVASQSGLIVVGLMLLGALALAPFWLGLTVLAAVLGFLPFNLPRARIFLGDVGSHALGYCLALLCCRAWLEGQLALPQIFLLCSALLMDAGLTLAGRIGRGERFWQAHCQHLYQWALRRGVSHPRVCLAYLVWTSFGLLLASTVAATGRWQAGSVAAAVAVLAAGLYLGLRRRWAARLATGASPA